MFSRSTRESMLVVKTQTTRMRGVVCAFLALTLLMFGSGASGDPVTLLFDDFEAYAPGTGIAGQGGWYAFRPVQAPIIVATGSGLGSLVLNGGIRTGDGSYTDPNEPIVMHSLSGPLTATGISTLSADAYAFSSYHSHSASVGLSNSDWSVLFYWYADWYGDPRGTAKWAFASCGVGDISIFQGGFDQTVGLEVIIDGLAGEVYGRLTHSGGSYETTHVAIAPEQLASLTEVRILEDYRDPAYLGAEFDNVRVTTTVSTIPAVSEWGLVVMAALMLAAGAVVVSRRRAAG